MTTSLHLFLSSFRVQCTPLRATDARSRPSAQLRLRVLFKDARPAVVKSPYRDLSSSMDTVAWGDAFECSWDEVFKGNNSDIETALRERSLVIKLLGRTLNERKHNLLRRAIRRTEELLGSCQVDLWTACTGPVQQSLIAKDANGEYTDYRIEFRLKAEQRKNVVFRLLHVSVDLDPALSSDASSRDHSDSDHYCPEPYLVISFVGPEIPRVVSHEKKLPTLHPEWSTLPSLEVPNLSVADLVAGYVLVKVHDACNRNRLICSFKINMHRYWACVRSPGSEFPFAATSADDTEKIRGILTVTNPPRTSQMRGGVHSDDGITDGRPLVYGIPLPLGERRDDTVWGTRTPVLQGWIELLDSFGYIYYHNIANRCNSWLKPGEVDPLNGVDYIQDGESYFRLLSDGTESWIHPRARHLERLTISTTSSGELGFTPAQRGTLLPPPFRSESQDYAGQSSASTSAMPGPSQAGLSDPESSSLVPAVDNVRQRRAGGIPKVCDETGLLTDMRWTSLDITFSRRLFPGPGTEGHSLTCINNGNTILKFGGASADSSKNNDLFAFDVYETQWRPLRTSGIRPTPSTAHGSAALGNGSRVLIFGGASRRGRLNDLHILDTECWKWAPVLGTTDVIPRPRARLGMTAMPNGTAALVFGGREGYRYLGDRYYNDVHIFDAYRVEWLLVKPTGSGLQPAPRSGCVVEMINDRQMFVHGGYDDGDRYYDDTWLLDTVSWSWQRTPYPEEPHRPSARESHTSAVMGDSVITFGGDRESGGYLADVHVFNSSTLRWSGQPVVTGNSPSGRSGACMAPMDSQRVVLIGGDNGFSMSSETHTLDIAYTSKAHVEEMTDQARREGPSASTCIICLDAPVEAVFLWCGHYVCCMACASRVRKYCPICRRWVSKVSRVKA